MKPKNNYIAIDLGAGSGRIMLGTLRGMELGINEIHRFDHNAKISDGFLRWNWNHISKEISTGLKKACDFLRDESITSISCDSWSQDFGLLDKDGKLIFSPVSYRDGRTTGIPEEISEVISPAKLHRRNGSSLSPITTLCQLKSMAATMFEILENAALLLNMANLAHFELCGVGVSDWTMATASQLWNIGTDSWDFELLEMLGIPSQFLPEVIRKPESIGVVRPEKAPHWKLPGVPVVSTAGHDTAAAAAVLYPLDKGTLFLSLGTGRFLELIDKVTEKEIRNIISSDRKIYDISSDVTADIHGISVKLEIAMRRLMEENELDAFSMNFREFIQDGRVPAMPFLGINKLMGEGLGYAGEGDIAIAALISQMRQLAGIANFTEIYTLDYKQNLMVMTHMQECNPAMARKNAKIKLDEPVGDFLNRYSMAGGTHHIAAMPGKHAGAVTKLARFHGFELKNLNRRD